MPSFNDYLTRTFPNIRVTSGARDPNSRLGRANPRSWHNKGMAWDVAPLSDMTYDQYVDRIRRDGWDVLEARDEVKNPSAHATGPHWHVAVSGRKEPVVNNLASLMQSVYPMAQQEAQQPGGLASLLQGAIQPEIPPMQVPDARLPDPNKRPLWKDILGGVLDTIAVAGGRQGGYWPVIQQEQALETEGRRRLEEQQRVRQEKIADWLMQQEYQRANPEPSAMERDLASWNSMTPEQQAQYAAMMDVRSPVAVSGPGGTYRVPRGYGQQPTNAPTTQTIDGMTYYNINGRWYDNPEGR